MTEVNGEDILSWTLSLRLCRLLALAQQARRPYRGDNPDVIRHGHVDFRSSESFCVTF